MTRFHDHGMIGTWLIGAEERRATDEVVQSRSLFRHYGPQLLHKVSAFEDESCRILGAPHALATSSGTAALRCALAALGLRKGDEVLLPPCTFAATANVVVLAGGVPVFCEIDDSLGLDPRALCERLSERTVGIVAVHLQGMACQISELSKVAQARGLWLIEDAAQAFGTAVGGRAVGTFGVFGAYSLQAHKTITCGEGGLLVSGDRERFCAARRYHDQGGERDGDAYPSWEADGAGFGENLKMSELQGAVALAQLGKLEHIRERMRGCYRRLVDEVALCGRSLRVDPSPEGSLPHSFLFYAHNPADQAHILEELTGNGIPCDGLYDAPIYRSAPFVRWSRGEAVLGCPDPSLRPKFEPCLRAEGLMARIVRIPLSPAYTPADMELLASALNHCLESR